MNRTTEDKRVTKTKKNLKNTLWEMLKELPFEKITVKGICDRAVTSRITFYNYYQDKYTLLEACFDDISDELEIRFDELQKKNNQADDPFQSYSNMLDSFLDNYFDNFAVFSRIEINNDSVLFPPYYRYMIRNTTLLVNKYFHQLKPKYPPKTISLFVVSGLFGCSYFDRNHELSETDHREIYETTHCLLNDILNSDIFSRSQ